MEEREPVGPTAASPSSPGRRQPHPLERHEDRRVSLDRLPDRGGPCPRGVGCAPLPYSTVSAPSVPPAGGELAAQFGRDASSVVCVVETVRVTMPTSGETAASSRSRASRRRVNRSSARTASRDGFEPRGGHRLRVRAARRASRHAQQPLEPEAENGSRLERVEPPGQRRVLARSPSGRRAPPRARQRSTRAEPGPACARDALDASKSSSNPEPAARRVRSTPGIRTRLARRAARPRRAGRRTAGPGATGRRTRARDRSAPERVQLVAPGRGDDERPGAGSAAEREHFHVADPRRRS